MSMQQIGLTPEQREKVLQDMLVSQDGRWFLKATGDFGFDAATKLNIAVSRSMGKTEMKRLLTETGHEVKNIEDFKAIMDLLADLYWPEMQKYEFKIIDENTFSGQFFECYVHKMASEAGTKDIHQCAGKYKAEGWVEACGLKAEVIGDKNTNNCDGTCEHIFKITKWGKEG